MTASTAEEYREREDRALESITKLCEHIRAHPGDELTLSSLSEMVGMSPYHLQRTFKRVVGVSPREYVEAVRLGAFRQLLRDDGSMRSSSYRLGHSSTSWPYAKGRSVLGMEARAFRKGGAGENVSFATTRCSLGLLLVAGTSRGVCFVALTDSPEAAREALLEEYPRAKVYEDEGQITEWLGAVADHLDGRGPPALDALPLDIRATAFQWRVWNHLRSIPAGTTESYGEVAMKIGAPRSARAVGNACGSNPVAIVIPCHRVVAAHEGLGGYRWGLERKKAVLRREGARVADGNS